MNKIYCVKWMNFNTLHCVNVLVQGENLNAENAKKKAEKAIKSGYGSKYFKGLDKTDVIDITDREILSVEFSGDNF